MVFPFGSVTRKFTNIASGKNEILKQDDIFQPQLAPNVIDYDKMKELESLE